MKILLTAATQAEIDPYLAKGPKHDVLITGVGIPSAVYQLTKQLSHHHYDLVVQAGIAGSSDSSIQIGDVVAVEQDSFAALGAWETGQFSNLQQMQLGSEAVWFYASKQWLTRTGLPLVKGGTVSTITDNEFWLQAMQQCWPHQVESMEGAALYYVAHQLRQPCLQIRGISNLAGDRNKANWNIPVAIHNLNNFLYHFLPGLEG